MILKHRYQIFQYTRERKWKIVFGFLELQLDNYSVVIPLDKGSFDYPEDERSFIESLSLSKLMTNTRMKKYFLWRIIDIDRLGEYFTPFLSWQKALYYKKKDCPEDNILHLFYTSNMGYSMRKTKVIQEGTFQEYDLRFTREEAERIVDRFNSFCRCKDICYLFNPQAKDKWKSTHEIDSSIIFRNYFKYENLS